MISLIFSFLLNNSSVFLIKKNYTFFYFILLIQLEIYSIFNNDFFIYYFLIIILLFESISDCINNEIYSPLNYLLFLIGICNTYFINRNIYDLLITLLIPFTLYLLSLSKGLGNGDVEVFFVLSFYFEFRDLLYILLFTSIFACIYLLINKKDKIALLPFITYSVLLIILYN